MNTGLIVILAIAAIVIVAAVLITRRSKKLARARLESRASHPTNSLKTELIDGAHVVQNTYYAAPKATWTPESLEPKHVKKPDLVVTPREVREFESALENEERHRRRRRDAADYHTSYGNANGSYTNDVASAALIASFLAADESVNDYYDHNPAEEREVKSEESTPVETPYEAPASYESPSSDYSTSSYDSNGSTPSYGGSDSSSSYSSSSSDSSSSYSSSDSGGGGSFD